MKGWVITALLLLGCASADSRPGHGGSATNSACFAYTAQIAVDGCVGAPVGEIQDVNMFTTMRQSGQLQYFSAPGVQSNHPIDYNAPGIDYPVGNIPSAIVAQGGYKIPGVNTLPTNVSLNTSTHTLTFDFTSGADITFQGWNITGYTAVVSGTGGGTLHWWNNKWQESPFTYSQSSLNGLGVLRSTSSSCTNYDVQSSEFIRDFNTYPIGTLAYYVYQGGGGTCKPTTTVHYSYLRQVAEHAVRVDGSGASDVKWNYFRGMGQCPDGDGGLTEIPTGASCAHGNFYVQFATQTPTDIQDVSFNTMWTDTDSMSSTALLAWFINRTPAFTIHYTMLRSKYNIMASNVNSHYTYPLGGATWPIGTGGYTTRYLQQGSGTAVVDAAEMIGNHIDCTGGLNVAIQGTSNVASVLVGTGNVLMNNGSAITPPPDQFTPTGANGCKQFPAAPNP